MNLQKFVVSLSCSINVAVVSSWNFQAISYSDFVWRRVISTRWARILLGESRSNRTVESWGAILGLAWICSIAEVSLKRVRAILNLQQGNYCKLLCLSQVDRCQANIFSNSLNQQDTYNRFHKDRSRDLQRRLPQDNSSLQRSQLPRS